MPAIECVELEALAQAGSVTRGLSGVVDRRRWGGFGFRGRRECGQAHVHLGLWECRIVVKFRGLITSEVAGPRLSFWTWPLLGAAFVVPIRVLREGSASGHGLFRARFDWRLRSEGGFEDWFGVYIHHSRAGLGWWLRIGGCLVVLRVRFGLEIDVFGAKLD